MTKSSIKKVQRRDGRIVPFNQDKISNAIHKAFVAVEQKNGKIARKLSDEVVRVLEKKFKGKLPQVEEIQDIVEETLIKNKYPKVAKAYIIYRQKRTELRQAKRFFGVKDELKLSINATKVLEKRYLMKNEKAQVVETPMGMFRRVAKTIAAVDKKYDKKADVKNTEEDFYQLMVNLEFLPNSPTLMNAGTPLGQLSACFVLPIEDDLKSIFSGVENAALIHQSGGGTGFSFSKVRPRGDVVKSTMGIASGPVSFMRVFDVMTDVIKQGGRRRGANMGILKVDHPDIMDFITSKSKAGFLTNFNISVALTDKFMKAVEKNEDYNLINPRTGKVTNKIKARDIFDLIVTMAWKNGDPGVVFLDEVNRYNPTPKIGEIESTNPCGEQPLLSYESCNLGSINLSKMVKEEKIDWQKLKKTVHIAVHYLDNVIDANKYPLPETEKITKKNRKIGLGIMGFADMLIMLDIPYDSEKALEIGGKIMKFIEKEAKEKSEEIAKKRGSFSNFKGSIWDKRGYKRMRNATLTTIAPTGTISIIAGCSSGIEPLFAIAFVRNVMEGSKLLEVNSLFEKIAREKEFYSSNLMMGIAKTGSVQKNKSIPKHIRRLFTTALDIAPEWHVKMQAAFQKYTDNAVSKTVNFPADASMEDVEKVFKLAYKLKCKGVTVYRYGSKKEQVLYLGSSISREGGTFEHISADSEYSGGCPAWYCHF